MVTHPATNPGFTHIVSYISLITHWNLVKRIDFTGMNFIKPHGSFRYGLNHVVFRHLYKSTMKFMKIKIFAASCFFITFATGH